MAYALGLPMEAGITVATDTLFLERIVNIEIPLVQLRGIVFGFLGSERFPVCLETVAHQLAPLTLRTESLRGGLDIPLESDPHIACEHKGSPVLRVLLEVVGD